MANLRLGKILIHAANGAVAAKLRQVEPRLTGVFRYVAPEVTGIDIRVQPRTETVLAQKVRTAASIGLRQKQALTSLADGLPDESPLRAALKRLVDRA